jgi:uncharacterized membrane protein YqjE
VAPSQQDTESSPGIFEAAKTFAGSLLEHAQTRLELLTVEWAEEKTRLTGLLITLTLALFFSCLAVTFGSLLVLVFFWDTPHRLAAVTGIVLFYLLAAIVTWIVVRAKMRTKSALFSTSAAELRRDRQLLDS